MDLMRDSVGCGEDDGFCISSVGGDEGTCSWSQGCTGREHARKTSVSGRDTGVPLAEMSLDWIGLKGATESIWEEIEIFLRYTTFYTYVRCCNSSHNYPFG